MVDQKADKSRDCLLQPSKQIPLIWFKPVQRIEGFPNLGEPGPLGMRVKRSAHCAAELHANPRNRMRVADRQAKYKGTGQAHHSDESERGTYAHLPTENKSATISDIQRSQSCQGSA